MGTRTKCQAWIEHHVYGIGIRHIAPAWADPQTFAELHGMEIVHPLALPVFVFQLLDFMHKSRAQKWVIFQNRHDLFHVCFCVEQTNNIGITPQARFAWQWLKHRCVMRILESNGNRSDFH
ncbi:hypothetical protein D3C78_985890 [compost metagenome]